ASPFRTPTVGRWQNLFPFECGWAGPPYSGQLLPCFRQPVTPFGRGWLRTRRLRTQESWLGRAFGREEIRRLPKFWGFFPTLERAQLLPWWFSGQELRFLPKVERLGPTFERWLFAAQLRPPWRFLPAFGRPQPTLSRFRPSRSTALPLAGEGLFPYIEPAMAYHPVGTVFLSFPGGAHASHPDHRIRRTRGPGTHRVARPGTGARRAPSRGDSLRDQLRRHPPGREHLPVTLVPADGPRWRGRRPHRRRASPPEHAQRRGRVRRASRGRPQPLLRHPRRGLRRGRALAPCPGQHRLGSSAQDRSDGGRRVRRRARRRGWCGHTRRPTRQEVRCRAGHRR